MLKCECKSDLPPIRLKKFRVKHYISLVMLLAFLLPNTALSQTLSERMKLVSSKSFIQAFLGMCVQNPGTYDRVIEIAKALRYRNIPERFVAGFAPQDPRAEWAGFIILEGKGSPYFFGASKGNMDHKVLVTCTISNYYLESQKVVIALKKFAGLAEPIQDQRAAGQRYRTWSYENWVKGSLISMTDSEPMGLSGVTIAFVSPLEE